MSTDEKSARAERGANVVSQILVDTDGRVFVSNLSPDLLDALKICCAGDPFLAGRFEPLEDFKRRKE